MNRLLDKLKIAPESRNSVYRAALVFLLLLGSNGTTFSLLSHQFEVERRAVEEAAISADPTPLTEKQIFAIIFSRLDQIGAEVPPNSPNQQQAQRRQQAGQVLCELAIVMQPDPGWIDMVDFACVSLNNHWPGYGCPVCDN